jgi:nucleotide-binding universal stress UspA family protein
VFRNVLVGIDGSASATQALGRAIEIARASGGRLGLLSVALRPSLGISLQRPPFVLPITTPQLAAQLQIHAQGHLDQADRTVPADVPVTKLVSRGSVADALLEHTRNGPWDLIVIGHRNSADHWPLRRGVGNRLLRASPVPVLVVRNASTPAPTPPRRSRRAARSRRHRFASCSTPSV